MKRACRSVMRTPTAVVGASGADGLMAATSKRGGSCAAIAGASAATSATTNAIRIMTVLNEIGFSRLDIQRDGQREGNQRDLAANDRQEGAVPDRHGASQ